MNPTNVVIFNRLSNIPKIVNFEKVNKSLENEKLERILTITSEIHIKSKYKVSGIINPQTFMYISSKFV